MTDEAKIWRAVIGCVAFVAFIGSLLIANYNNHQAALRQAACANPETVACALAVRK